MSSRTLSVIIPVYNIAGHIEHLAGEMSKLAEIDAEVIVVDDGSSNETVEALRTLKADVAGMTLIECPGNAGAGAARNTGFSQADGKYTLFFDGDDTLHADGIAETIEALDRSGADVSINSYEFIRDGQSRSAGMNVIDRVLWKEYFGRFPGDTFRLADAPRFLEFTNYPWNKIIRTEHYQTLGLDPLFGETRVNNDILGHWNILLNAQSLVLVDRTIVTHHVSGARDHLSNRFGRERLDLFVALRSVHDILRVDPDLAERYAPTYWSFVKRLVIWAEGKMQEDVAARFATEARALVCEVSFAELLEMQRSEAAGTYRWLMDRIC